MPRNVETPKREDQIEVTPEIKGSKSVKKEGGELKSKEIPVENFKKKKIA
jgi:hypothetical protein